MGGNFKKQGEKKYLAFSFCQELTFIARCFIIYVLIQSYGITKANL